MTQTHHDHEINLNDIFQVLKIFRKRKWAFLGFVFACVALGSIYCYTARPVYQSDAIILIGTKTSDSFGDDKGFEEIDPTKTDYYKTQYAMIKSKSLAKRVINKLNLVESDEFKKEPPLFNFSFKKVEKFLQSFFINTGMAKPPVAVEKLNSDPEYKMVDTFSSRLVVSPVTQSHVVRVGFKGYDPTFITEITNVFLDTLIEVNIERRGKILDGSERWMVEKLEELKQKMKDAELKLSNFRKKNDIIDFKKNREISAENLSRYQDEIRKVTTEKLRLADLKDLLFKLKKDPTNLLNTLPDNVKTKSINELITEYAVVLKDYSNLTQQYSSLHPEVQINFQKVKEMENKIPQEIDRLISSIDIDYRGTVLNEQSLQNAMQAEKVKIMRMDNEEFTFNSLTDEFESNKILHNDLLKRFKEVDIASYSDESAIQIVDKAEIPFRPVEPRKNFVFAISLLLGVSGGSFWIFFLEKMNKSMITVEDVVRQIPFPFLGATGIIGKRDLPLPVVNHSNTFIAEEFRTVKTNLMLNGFVEPHKVLMVSSSTPREGKTTVLTNLAATFAQENKRVLIIDGDFVRPKIAEAFQVRNQPGLIDILEGPRLFKRIMENHILDSRKIDDIFVKTAVDGIYILPRGTLTSDFTDTLNYGIFEKLLAVTKKTFDIVLLDTPPALAFSYVSIAAQLCDGVLFVIGSGMKDKDLIKRTLSQLSAASSDWGFKTSSNGKSPKKVNGEAPFQKSKIFGVVLNKVKYQRDAYYEYHRKYFRDYYSNMDSKPKKKPVSV